MTKTIAVAGATGELGKRVVHALLARGAKVQALVRATSDSHRVTMLREAGATIVQIRNVIETARDLAGASCFVSTVAGLRETVVEAQSALVETAVAAGIPRFIPSDFAADFTKLASGENRNFDLRREFHGRLDRAEIEATSILNGAFADMLPTPYSPFFDFEARRVNYYGSPDQALDFTTMDDVAAFTSAAALDDATPKVLKIAGDQISARQMAAAATGVLGTPFTLFRLGSLDELGAKIAESRQSDPTAESNVYAPFQMMQYLHNMASGRAKLDIVDNDRYPGLTWTRVEDLLEAGAKNAA